MLTRMKSSFELTEPKNERFLVVEGGRSTCSQGQRDIVREIRLLCRAKHLDDLPVHRLSVFLLEIVTEIDAVPAVFGYQDDGP